MTSGNSTGGSILSLIKAKGIPPWVAWVSVCMACTVGIAAGLLLLGGRFLVAPDPLPTHAQVAVVLSGSITGEEARRTEAVRLLQSGTADHVLLSVGRAFFWGQWLPDMARNYMEEKYGKETARRITLCEMNAQSTLDEAMALRDCLEALRSRSVIIVTSNYHTRRARKIWGAVSETLTPPLSVRVHGVADGEFEPTGWWRKRRYAKTWLLEMTKLTWTYVEAFLPSLQDADLNHEASTLGKSALPGN